jgi:hypothetical protein
MRVVVLRLAGVAAVRVVVGQAARHVALGVQCAALARRTPAAGARSSVRRHGAAANPAARLAMIPADAIVIRPAVHAVPNGAPRTGIISVGRAHARKHAWTGDRRIKRPNNRWHAREAVRRPGEDARPAPARAERPVRHARAHAGGGHRRAITHAREYALPDDSWTQRAIAEIGNVRPSDGQDALPVQAGARTAGRPSARRPCAKAGRSEVQRWSAGVHRANPGIDRSARTAQVAGGPVPARAISLRAAQAGGQDRRAARQRGDGQGAYGKEDRRKNDA